LLLEQLWEYDIDISAGQLHGTVSKPAQNGESGVDN
jgi:hypothetical protein